MDTNIALINAGSFRSDCIDVPGKITQQTVNSILPFQDQALVADYTGRELLEVLENSVSQYPLLDGRFLQVSGITFKFDPRLPAGKRIHPGDVLCKLADSSLKQIEEDYVYRVAAKTFIHLGKDGYLAGCPSKVVSESNTTIASMVSTYLNVDDEFDEVPTMSPIREDRVVCLYPDPELLEAYEYADY